MKEIKIDDETVTAVLDAVGSDIRELAAVCSQLVADTDGQVDATAAAQFVEQQRRDQKPAQHEEHVDTEESTRHPGDAAVIGEHQRNRHRTQPVQRTNTRTAFRMVAVVARPAGGQPARRRRGDPSGLASRMNRHGVRPGRFHVHLSSAPTGFLVGGFVAADTRVPLPADAGVSLGAQRPQ